MGPGNGLSTHPQGALQDAWASDFVLVLIRLYGFGFVGLSRKGVRVSGVWGVYGFGSFRVLGSGGSGDCTGSPAPSAPIRCMVCGLFGWLPVLLGAEFLYSFLGCSIITRSKKDSNSDPAFHLRCGGVW